MKNHKTRLTALTMFVLAVALFTAPAAVLAQEKAPVAKTSTACAATTISVAQVDPSVSGSGFPDEGFDYTPPTPAADAKPVNPVIKACENGKIKIMVGNEQQFGNRIGAIVEVRILLLIDDGVTVDFASLQRGTLNFDGTDRFHLAKDNPVTIAKEQKNGKTLYTIDMRLQSFVPKPSIPLNIDLRYATSLVAATHKPDWKVLTTPDFMVTTSNTVDNGEDLLEGNMQSATVAAPWPIRTLFYTGASLLVLWPLVTLVLWLIRKRPGRKTPPSELAWSTFSKVFKDGAEVGYQERHFRHLVDALKGYLGAGTRTREEIGAMLEGDKRQGTVISALKKCDMALYAAEHNGTGRNLLTETELAELIAQIKEIVPQPE
jgi:hypothetical protein